MWTVGSQWLSVITSSGSALYRIIPAAPPWKTLKPRAIRPAPRWQTTIFPVKSPAGAGVSQPTLLYGGSDPLTTGSGLAMPEVMVAPETCWVAPPPLRVMVERKVRVCVEAATVSTHGEL